MHFFPSEAGVSAEEGIRFFIRLQGFTDVADSHQDTDYAWTTERGTWIASLSVSMYV